jgi:hypothetical protein
MRFPAYDYHWEIGGFGANFTCDATTVLGDVQTAWFTPTCSNLYPQIISAWGSNPAYTPGTNMLNVAVHGVKAPMIYTESKNFVLSTYNNVDMKFLDRSYGTASADDLLSFQQNKFLTYVDDGDDEITIGVGIVEAFNVRTASSLIPAKADLTFEASVVARNGDLTGFTLEPTTVTIAAGTH